LHVPERGENRGGAELHSCHGLPPKSGRRASRRVAFERCGSRGRHRATGCPNDSLGDLEIIRCAGLSSVMELKRKAQYLLRRDRPQREGRHSPGRPGLPWVIACAIEQRDVLNASNFP
jgi:hypothetical protein